MNLDFVVEDIGKDFDRIRDYKVFVIEDEEKVNTDACVEYYALKVECDDDDDENDINIMTNQLSGERLSESEAITVAELNEKLRELIPRFADRSMYSASAKKSDGDYWIRLDIPLVAIGRDHDRHVFSFIQQKGETK